MAQSTERVTGARMILQSLADLGVSVCFANPGTSEMAFVRALEDVTTIRPILTLFEGVATGAADGFGRIADRAAMCLLHTGPGLANGLANLHNAKRAHSPVLIVVGDLATWHRGSGAPLDSDVRTLAEPMADVVLELGLEDDPADVAAEAFAATQRRGGQVVVLIVPQDCAEGEHDPGASGTVEPASARRDDIGPDVGAEALAGRLTSDAAILLGGRALTSPAIRLAERIGRATGCAVVRQGLVSSYARGGDTPELARAPLYPFMPNPFEKREFVACISADEPVTAFGYAGRAPRFIPDDADIEHFCRNGEDPIQLLEAVASRVAPDTAPAPVRAAGEAPLLGPENLTVESLGLAIAQCQPEGCIVVDEANTSGIGWAAVAPSAPAHTVLELTGGAIGMGLPAAVGVATAAPNRKVLALQADGSGLYTAQALWTMAREKLDVVVVICANHRYQILEWELGAEPGPAGQRLTRIDQPRIDWVRLADAFGVSAHRGRHGDAFLALLREGMSAPGPLVIQAELTT